MAKALVILLAMAAAAFSCARGAWAEEEFTLTTYYPSPYGNYNQLNADTVTFNPRAKDAPACTRKNEGSVHYRKSEGRLYMCNGVVWRNVSAGGFTEVRDFQFSSSEDKVVPLGEWDLCLITGIISNAGGGPQHGCRLKEDKRAWSMSLGANGRATVQCDARCGNF